MSEAKTAKKKGFKLPDTYVLITMMLFVMAILTYIIPAGKYDEYYDEVAGRTVVDATSFHYVEKTPVGPITFLKSIQKGMENNYSMILQVIMMGAYFGLANDTGAISKGIAKGLELLKEKIMWGIPPVMLLFGILGATGAVVNSIIAFIPIGLVLAKQMKMDRIAAMGIIYTGCFSGWCTSFMAVGSVQLAQKMAGLPLLSGTELRMCVTAVIVVVTIPYVMRYCAMIRKDPTKSYLWGSPEYEIDDGSAKQSDAKFGWKDGIIILLVFGGIFTYVYGAVAFGWGADWMCAIMLFCSVTSGLISGMKPDDISKSIIKGAKSTLYGALLIGWASAVAVLMTEGQIIHTVIYGLSLPLSAMPTTMAAVMMFLVNSVFNFFVSSASGQAAIVMPIMAPLADVVGVTRQVAILAYQYGDGLSNTIIPTSGVLMGCLGMAGIPYAKWLKFQVPLFLIWTVICAIAIVIAVMIGYN